MANYKVVDGNVIDKPVDKRFRSEDESNNVHFDLKKSVIHNFDLYQGAIKEYPKSSYQLKLRYDQYLKTYPHYKSEQKIDVSHDIAFDVTGK